MRAWIAAAVVCVVGLVLWQAHLSAAVKADVAAAMQERTSDLARADIAAALQAETTWRDRRLVREAVAVEQLGDELDQEAESDGVQSAATGKDPSAQHRAARLARSRELLQQVNAIRAKVGLPPFPPERAELLAQE